MALKKTIKDMQIERGLHLESDTSGKGKTRHVWASPNAGLPLPVSPHYLGVSIAMLSSKCIDEVPTALQEETAIWIQLGKLGGTHPANFEVLWCGKKVKDLHQGDSTAFLRVTIVNFRSHGLGDQFLTIKHSGRGGLLSERKLKISTALAEDEEDEHEAAYMARPSYSTAPRAPPQRLRKASFFIQSNATAVIKEDMLVIPGTALLHHTHVPHRHRVGLKGVHIAVHKTKASYVYAELVDDEIRTREKEKGNEENILNGNTSEDIARFLAYQSRVAEKAGMVLASFARAKRLSHRIDLVTEEEKRALAVSPASSLSFVQLDLTKACEEDIVR